MKKILFIDSTHPMLAQLLQDAGYQIDYDYNSSKQEIEKLVSAYFGVIIRSRFKIDKKFINSATNLKFIGRVGAGMENIEVDYARSKNIHCISSPEGNRDAVGEQTMGMLLALSNHIVKANNEVKTGLWLREANRGFEIKGKTVAIIGYGNMGSAFAQRLSGFESRVIAYDKYKTGFSSPFVEEVSMEEIFENADIISFHVPYTPETHYLFCKEYIDKFKKSIYLLNTSRGKVVSNDHLVEALISGKVAGAALDVLETEDVSLKNAPQSDWSASMNYLAESSQVILTPHIAGWTKESNIKLSTIIAEKVIDIFK